MINLKSIKLKKLINFNLPYSWSKPFDHLPGEQGLFPELLQSR